MKSSVFSFRLRVGLVSSVIFCGLNPVIAGADASYFGSATKSSPSSSSENFGPALEDAVRSLGPQGELNAEGCAPNSNTPGACDKQGLRPAQVISNQMGFDNFNAGALGHCWGMSVLERALRAGASFSRGSGERENITEKIKRLLKGEPQTFTSAGSIRELTQRYQGEIKKLLESIQRKRFYGPLNLRFAFKSAEKSDNSKPLKEIASTLASGAQPLVVLNAGLSEQHVVTVIGINGSRLKVVDSNFPGRVPREVVCSGGSCRFEMAPGFPKPVAVTIIKDNDLKISKKLASSKSCAKSGV